MRAGRFKKPSINVETNKEEKAGGPEKQSPEWAYRKYSLIIGALRVRGDALILKVVIERLLMAI